VAAAAAGKGIRINAAEPDLGGIVAVIFEGIAHQDGGDPAGLRGGSAQRRNQRLAGLFLNPKGHIHAPLGTKPAASSQGRRVSCVLARRNFFVSNWNIA
jgi:hypothetical protein